MRRIGIRELRQNASQYIRLVKAGETIEVTERDVPVARLTPVPVGESVLDRLEREGKLRRATKPWGSVKPLDPVPGERPLSEILQEMRDDERY